MNRVLLIAVFLAASVAASLAAPVDMDVSLDPIPLGTSDGTIDLDLVLDAVVIEAPDAYVSVQLWGRDRDGDWYRVRPVLQRPTLDGTILPASPGDWTTFTNVWVWPAVGNVSRIVYDRTDATAIYISGRRAANQ